MWPKPNKIYSKYSLCDMEGAQAQRNNVCVCVRVIYVCIDARNERHCQLTPPVSQSATLHLIPNPLFLHKTHKQQPLTSWTVAAFPSNPHHRGNHIQEISSGFSAEFIVHWVRAQRKNLFSLILIWIMAAGRPQKCIIMINWSLRTHQWIQVRSAVKRWRNGNRCVEVRWWGTDCWREMWAKTCESQQPLKMETLQAVKELQPTPGPSGFYRSQNNLCITKKWSDFLPRTELEKLHRLQPTWHLLVHLCSTS